MKTEGIVVQVDEETAKIMRGISEQLSGEAEDQFDDLLEEIHTEFTNLKMAAKEQTNAAKQELVQTIEVSSRQVVDKIPTQLKTVQDALAENKKAVIISGERTQTKIENLQKDTTAWTNAIQEELREITETQKQIKDRQTADNISEQFKTLNASLIETNKMINGSIEKVHNEVEILKNTVETQTKSVLEEAAKQSEVAEQVSVAVGEVKTEAEKNFTELLGHLTALCDSVKEISAKQDMIIAKQIEIEKDVEYLKLPVYKRFFSGGK